MKKTDWREIPTTEVRHWLRERADVPPGRARPACAAHIAHFGPAGVGVAGRDYAYRSPEEAIREGAELILAGLLLEDHREQVLVEVADVEARRLEGYARSAAEYTELLGDIRRLLDEGSVEHALRLVSAALGDPKFADVYERLEGVGFGCRGCGRTAPCSWQVAHGPDCPHKALEGKTLRR